MLNFWQRRQSNRLYRQWVEHSGLRPEDIPEGLQPKSKETPEKEPAENAVVSPQEAPNQGMKGKFYSNAGMVWIPIRYIFFTGLLIALLFIALSIMSAVLVLRSC